MNKDASHWVYLIHAEKTDYYKIGRAIDPRLRMMALQVGCPFELKLLVMIEESEKGAADLESFIHDVYRAAWIRAEWYTFVNQEKLIHQFYRIMNPRFRSESEICPYVMAHDYPASGLSVQYGITVLT